MLYVHLGRVQAQEASWRIGGAIEMARSRRLGVGFGQRFEHFGIKASSFRDI